jgi:Holliday junction resolvase RusA-like endonuclease
LIRFVLPGTVVPQGRPRFARRGNYVQAYDPAECKDYKAYVRLLAAQAYKGPPLDGQICLTVRIYRLPPASWSKVKRAMALAGEIRPVSRPDLSNSLKGIEDALNGLIWQDDARIVEEHLYKWYGDEPRAEIEIDNA